MENIANHIHLLRPPIIKLWSQKQLIKVTVNSIPERLALVDRFARCYRLEENRPDFDGKLRLGDLAYLITAPDKAGYVQVLGVVVFSRIGRSREWKLAWHWLHPFTRKRGLVALAIDLLNSRYRRAA